MQTITRAQPLSNDGAGAGANAGRGATAVVALLLFGVTAAIYAPVAYYGFVAYDDPEYVAANPMVQAGLTWSGVKWAMTAEYACNWHPVTWWSHMLDVELFGRGPAGPHVVNVALHLANTLLLFTLLRFCTGAVWRSAVVAAIFAWHPLRVESVAWVSERKDVLSAFFFLLTVWAYVKWTRAVRGGGRAERGVASGRAARGVASESGEGRGEGTPRAGDIHRQRSEESTVSPVDEPGTGGALPSPLATFTCPSAHRAVLRPSAPGAVRWYITALLFFALGLMAKPMLVTLPFVLLLLDWWPLGRWNPQLRLRPAAAGAGAPPPAGDPGSQRGEPATQGGRLGTIIVARGDTAAVQPRRWPLLIEKIPFFLLTAISCGLTFAAQNHSGAVRSLTKLSLAERGANAVVSVSRYLGKLFWPVDLAFFYPPVGRWPWELILIAAALLVGITYSVLRLWRHPFALVGWLWFCGMLVPVIGLVQVGDQALADRFTYLPAIGVYVALAWGAAEVTRRFPAGRVAIGAVVVAALIACGCRSRDQLRHWRDTGALCAHAIAVTSGNFVAYNVLASDYLKRGEVDAAIPHLEKALAIRPDYDVAHHNLGIVLWHQGELRQSLAHFRRAVEIQPGSPYAQNNLGWMLRLNGRLEESEAHLRKALEIRPGYSGAHNNLGKTMMLKGEWRAAAEEYQAALASEPNNVRALANLAWLCATAPDPALRDGARALQLAEQANRLSDTCDPVILEALAAAYAENGRFTDAVATAERGRQLATNQSDGALTAAFERELLQYRANAAYRDAAGITPLLGSNDRS